MYSQLSLADCNFIIYEGFFSIQLYNLSRTTRPTRGFTLQKSAAKYGDTDDTAIINAMNEMKDYIEAIEMELQRSGVIPK